MRGVDPLNYFVFLCVANGNKNKCIRLEIDLFKKKFLRHFSLLALLYLLSICQNLAMN